jgi:cardiolipin synthase
MPVEAHLATVIGAIAITAEILGILTAIHALMSARTAQGTIAWVLSLVTFPFFALPLYWVFGRNKFQGYVDARRAGDSEIHYVAQQTGRQAMEDGLLARTNCPGRHVFEALAKMPFTQGNQVDLLVDGEAAFGSMFDAISGAQDYILIQFFIVRDDRLGGELKSRLIRKAREGVRVYFLYDEIGSHGLGNAYIRELSDSGVAIHPFFSTKGFWNRFQINFRNHRKIVIADGRIAYVGGLNVGDEYMGRDVAIGPWRDTNVKIQGPAVHAVQMSFLEDWYWATHENPPLSWIPRPAPQGDQTALVLPTGPGDDLETCGLFFVQMINSAQDRLWIASPYFVPDSQVTAALQLASLRGVDVRIMLPEHPDHLLVYLSSFSFLEETEKADVKVYRYQPGFMHHKVILVDDRLAAVGTANLDNRSFRLNFEITVLVDDAGFAGQVAEMLTEDFARCKPARPEDLLQRPFWFKVAVRLARLTAPLQ